ncbi:MAG: GPR endopeptidase [Acutalibacteraceae bacterium]|nr:GPR endopeptidase [Acutalibacteraceae bacterium]
MNFRTDLALERREMINDDIDGVEVTKTENDECRTTIIEIKTEEAAKRLGKGKGKYITLEVNPFSNEAAVSDGRLKALTESIKELLPQGDGTVLVAGVGNEDITSDALGPKTASFVFATRHISREVQKVAGFSEELRPVAAVSTGVLGKTGIESGEYIKSICEAVKPQCIITVDALAAGSVERLGTTIQMSDTGIAPGSGIGNTRARIDEDFLGVPVIAIGIPTVVDAISLSSELSGISPEKLDKSKLLNGERMIVAPKDIDLLVKNASYLLALSINCALQPTLTPKELYSLM